MVSLQNVSISRKIQSISVISLIGMLLLLAIALNQYKNTMIEDRQNKTRNIVETAYAITLDFAKRAKAGEISEEEAQKQAFSALSAMRYGEGASEGKGDYIFITNFDATTLMHPFRPDLIGKSMGDTKDPNGVALFREISNMAKNEGQGFVAYHWSKPGHDKPVAKISYVKGYAPWQWAIGTGIYMDDVDTAFMQAATLLAVIVAAILAIVLFISYLIGRNITKPLNTMTQHMAALATGKLDTEIEGQERGDEIGQMAEAVQVFKDNMIKAEELTREQKRDQDIKEQQRQLINRYIREFEVTMINVLDGLNEADRNVRNASGRVTGQASETKVQATNVAGASEEATANVQTVAAAAEELASSISEISRQVNQSSDIAKQAVDETRETNSKIQALANAVSRIGEVVELINSIADQTNLLALNATIEAARAGEAGKGFAVVASEVKNLANQTTRATEDISVQIDEIRSSTDVSVDAINSVTRIIENINEISGTIAAAVEEQGAATQEIAMNVDQASAGTQEVSNSIQHVQQAAESADEAAAELMTTSKDLATQSETLRAQVSRFLKQVQQDTTDEHTLFDWSEELESGNAQIDEDHKKLLDYINTLYHHIKEGTDRAVVENTFKDLKDYTRDHFSSEEKIMEQVGYPDLAAHKIEHADFIKRVQVSFDDYHQSDSEHVSVELIGLLASLWQNHIGTTDKAFAQFMKKQ